MATYNTTNVLSTLTGYSSTAWRTFGTNGGSNMVTTFNGIWTLTSRQQTSLQALTTYQKTFFNSWCHAIADAIDAGLASIDFSGMSISDSGAGSHPDMAWTLHTDWQWVGSAYVMTSAWITHDVSN